MTGGSQVVVRTPGGGTAIPIVIEPGAQVVLRTPGVQGDVGPASAGPVGGTTGQALVKTSNADHATGWAAPAPAAHAASHGSAGSDSVTLAQSQVINLATDLAAKVAAATYNAHTILAATTDDTPVALTVAEQTLLGRITGGNIAALTVAQIKTLLAYIAADVAAVPAIGIGAAATWISDDAVAPSTAIPAEAFLIIKPIRIERTTTVDRIGTEIVVAGSAGALVRLGIFGTSDLVTWSRVLDAGTIDATQVAGSYAITISQALQPGMYGVGICVQGGAGTRPTLTASTVSHRLIAGDTIGSWRQSLGGMGVTSVSGAFGTSYPTQRAAGLQARAFLRIA